MFFYFFIIYMSQNKINTLSSNSFNIVGMSQKMRYAQYIRNATARPKDPQEFVEVIGGIVITKWRTDFFIDLCGNAYVSNILRHIPDYQFFNNSLFR